MMNSKSLRNWMFTLHRYLGKCDRFSRDRGWYYWQLISTP